MPQFKPWREIEDWCARCDVLEAERLLSKFGPKAEYSEEEEDCVFQELLEQGALPPPPGPPGRGR